MAWSDWAIPALAVALGLSGCARDETLARYGAADRTWTLSRINDAPTDLTATLRFEANGAVTGQGPCGVFSARQTAPYPWFAIEDVLAGPGTCADRETETRFLATLTSMTQSEVSGPNLLLTNDTKGALLFTSSD